MLRKDPDRYVLVTPVERVGIVVEDAPFLAVEMAVEGEGDEPPDRLPHQCGRSRAGRTPDHPLRFEQDATGGVKPYVRVRGDLWARVTRALALRPVALGEERTWTGMALFGIAAGGMFFRIAPASELDAP